MPYATVRYYQNTVSDGNQRTVSGARDSRIGAEQITATGAFSAAPSGTVFASIETDVNIRFALQPPNAPVPVIDDTFSCFPGAAFVEQGAIQIEAGYVLHVQFY